MAPLSPRLSEHLRAPRAGPDPRGAPARGTAQNAACGDLLEIGLWLDEARRLRAGFRTQGCSALIATASLACAGLEGLTLAEAGEFELAVELERAGGLEANRSHAAAVVGRALDQALQSLRARYAGS